MQVLSEAQGTSTSKGFYDPNCKIKLGSKEATLDDPGQDHQNPSNECT